MQKIREVLSLSLMVVLGVLVFGVGAHGVAKAKESQQIVSTPRARELIVQLEEATDRFEEVIDGALDRSLVEGTDLEDRFKAMVEEFEAAADRLEDRAEQNTVIASDVRYLLGRGFQIDRFMKTHKLAANAEVRWTQTKNLLDQLARAYQVSWVWAPVSDPTLARASSRQVIRQLEERADAFRDSFADALDSGPADGTRYEDFMNKVVATFERSLDDLESQADRSEKLDADDLRIVLNNARAIDDFMVKQPMTPRARMDWARVKANLDDLAFINRVAWNWAVQRDAENTARIELDTQPRGETVSGLAGVGFRTDVIAQEVRHELLSDLPYYGVFDWIEFEVLPDRTVVLKGQVTSPPDTKSRAEAVVEDVEGVNKVVNQIEILPVSPTDVRLRRSLYQSIYGTDSPLFRYGIGSRQSIHIIVENGRATLKGVVDNEADKQLAYARARAVPGLFAVNNELRVDTERRLMR